MKKLFVISIYLAFGITLMRGGGTLAPSMAELPQVSFNKGTIAPEATYSEIGNPLGAPFPPHKLEPTGIDIPVSSLSPAGTGIAISPPKGKEVPTATPSPTSMAMATAGATWTATVTSVATGTATHTAGVRAVLTSHLLDRLVRNKPSIWGNKGLYILLAVLYLMLLGLFIKQILDSLEHRS